MANELRLAVVKRMGIKASLTRQKTFVNGQDAQKATKHTILERRRKLDELLRDFDAVQTEIETIELSQVGGAEGALGDLQTRQFAQSEEFESSFFSIAGIFSALLQPVIAVRNGPSVPTGVSTFGHSTLRRPTMRQPGRCSKRALIMSDGSSKDTFARFSSYLLCIKKTALLFATW